MVHTPLAVAAKTILFYVLVRILNTLYLRFGGFSYRISPRDTVIISAGCLAAALCWELAVRDDRRRSDTGAWDRLTGSGDGADR